MPASGFESGVVAPLSVKSHPTVSLPALTQGIVAVQCSPDPPLVMSNVWSAEPSSGSSVNLTFATLPPLDPAEMFVATSSAMQWFGNCATSPDGTEIVASPSSPTNVWIRAGWPDGNVTGAVSTSVLAVTVTFTVAGAESAPPSLALMVNVSSPVQANLGLSGVYV